MSLARYMYIHRKEYFGMIRSFFCLLLVGGFFQGLSQSSVRPLPMNINRPSLNLYAPFISGDGETMVYLSDYTDDGHHSMYWTTRKGVSEWEDGKEITRLINRPTLNFRGGYSLSFDGDLLLFTSRKSGIGGFDIWYSERNGKEWGAPKNFGKPLNTTSDEGSPSLSPDGEYLYFMRCESMSEYGGAKGCQIMVSKRNPRGWSEATALPENINTGNSQTPRILADDQTLIFSSDLMGGRGELDLFLSRRTETGWSDPVPLSFINTPYNDAFVSVPAKGRYMYESVKGDRDFQLVERLIPEEFRPARVMRIKGKVTHGNSPVEKARFVVFDVDRRTRLYQQEIAPTGEFSFVLPEGSNYDLAVTSSDPGMMYFAKPYALREIGRRDKEQLSIELKTIEAGELLSSALHFEPNGSALDGPSDFEVVRLARLLKQHPNMKIHLELIQPDYHEDSTFSEPDLTEVRTDTLWTPPADSVLGNPLATDSLAMDYFTADSVYFTYHPDSSALAYPRSFVKIRHTFHNDRTARQAESIINALAIKGIKEENITWSPLLIKREESPENREEEETPDQVHVFIREL